MVVVVMGYQHRIDVGQLLDGQCWRHRPFRAGEGERGATVGKHRISEQVPATVLEQVGGMADPGNLRVIAWLGQLFRVRSV